MSPQANELRRSFVSRLGFRLDRFQERALDALDAGQSVLVAAPTGSGKTVVAEYAVERARRSGKRAFYTTPLKALSNQKYGDFCRLYGPGSVGLLTGDTSVNPEAPVVVMTTEVLRNMIYQGADLSRLGVVVLDEVHYLEDPYRGPVWEEVIVHAPAEVDLVCLSATVSNAEELASWITTVRGATAAVIEERRPVELRHLYAVAERRALRPRLLPMFVDGRPSPEGLALDRARRGSRLRVPRTTELVELLSSEGLLPAIFFVFSRAGCDAAVRRGLEDGIVLTTPEERARIRELVEAKVAGLSDADLHVLGYGPFLAGLEAGLAPHHAGLVPPFKEAVEACFAEALVKAVFATETLALGINMPARSVVIDKLSKFSGERHELLTPGEYTQLTGRAGRRGIDEVGFAIVVWSPFVPFERVAALAADRSYVLSSSFRPTCNMAANLVRRYSRTTAHHLLNLSFAQYRADAAVVELEARLARAKAALSEALETEGSRKERPGRAAQDRRARGRGVEHHAGHERAERRAVEERLALVRPGHVLSVPGLVAGGRVAVTATSHRRGGEVRLSAVTVDCRELRLVAKDFPSPPEVVGQLELPVPYDPAARRFRRETAAALRRIELPHPVAGEPPGPTPEAQAGPDHDGDGPAPAPPGAVVDATRAAAPSGASRRVGRLEREVERLEREVERQGESLARQLDRVLELLAARGFVEGWRLTPAGERLARIYHESDLLVAECLEAGLLDGLDPPDLAGLVSVFTFEARRPGRTAPPPRTGVLAERLEAVEALAAELASAQRAAGVPETRPPDPGFVTTARAWAKGQPLHKVLARGGPTGGDFVRNVKQLLDLLRQLALVAPDPQTAKSARLAAEAMFRGVVEASSVVLPPEEAPSEGGPPPGTPG